MSDLAKPEDDESLPSIAYIDEQEDERSNFYTDAYDSGLFSAIYLVEPIANIEEMMAQLLDLKIEALVTDFNLTEAGPLDYSGEHLVERYLEVRSDFPCFIRTSYEEDALSVSTDVNRVYSKDVNADEHSDRPLFSRIALQIQKHREFVDGWRDELADLLNIDTTKRTATQVERLLELDHRLEATLGADAQIPKKVKEEIFGRRNNLHEQTEKLIEDMKRELGD